MVSASQITTHPLRARVILALFQMGQQERYKAEFALLVVAAVAGTREIVALFLMALQERYRGEFVPLLVATVVATVTVMATVMEMGMEMAMTVEEECYPQVAAQALPLRTGVQ
jgi:hypothetical protein